MSYDPQTPPPLGQPPVPPGYVPVDYASLTPSRPTSVTVIAIVGLVWACLTMLCMPVGLIRLLRPDLLPITGNVSDPTVTAAHDHPALLVWLLATNVIGLVLVLMLLVGSIGAMRFRPWGRSVSIAYAVGQLSFLLIATAVNLAFVMPLMSAALADPQARQILRVSLIAGGLGGLAFGAVLPVLILIFYRKPAAIEAFARAADNERLDHR